MFSHERPRQLLFGGGIVVDPLGPVPADRFHHGVYGAIGVDVDTHGLIRDSPQVEWLLGVPGPQARQFPRRVPTVDPRLGYHRVEEPVEPRTRRRPPWPRTAQW
jgi:hypothetical protein